MKCVNCGDYYSASQGGRGWCALWRLKTHPYEGCKFGFAVGTEREKTFAELAAAAKDRLKFTGSTVINKELAAAPEKETPKEKEPIRRVYYKTGIKLKQKRFLLPTRWQT